jgi:hypothetical protein
MSAWLSENSQIVESDPFEHKAGFFSRLMITTTVADEVGFSAALGWLKTLPAPCRLSLWIES